LAVAIGIPLGLFCGYVEGIGLVVSIVSAVIMRTLDAIQSFPGLMLALAISAVLGAGTLTVVVAIAVISVPAYGRVVRAQTLAIRHADYVVAAASYGAGDVRMVLRHIWPGVMPIVLVQASLGIGFAMITEASLSFLGLGVQPPVPSWGSMVGRAYSQVSVQPWSALGPGLALCVSVVSFNLLGDQLQALTDRRRRVGSI